jgi:tetratricopeptide (TPR) repeat protein
MQLLLTMPFMLLAGLTWGFFSAPSMGDGSVLFWSALGAGGFGFFFYLEQRLIPAIASFADRFGLAGPAVLAWEAVVVGGLLFLFNRVLGAPVIPAVATAIGVGAVYSLSMEYLLLGSGADHVANLLGLGRGWSPPRKSDHSYPDALARRGDLQGAEKAYREAIWNDPRDPLPYSRLAGVRVSMGLPEEAIEVLREGLKAARFDTNQEARFVRQIHEIFARQLDNGARAAPDLARYLERDPEGEHAEWARGELAYIKEQMLEHD